MAEEEKPKYNYALIFVIIALLIYGYKYYLGPTSPGTLLERGKDYRAKYYVLLYPEDAEVKNYRVPGEISKSGDSYTLFNVYWPNGGSTEFNCQLTINSTKEHVSD
jgi:hypothetical protein